MLDYNKEYFEANVLGILLERNMTQEELAKLTGIDKGNLNKYIHGKFPLTEYTLDAIATALNVSSESLLVPNSEFNNQLRIIKGYFIDDGISEEELKERVDKLVDIIPENHQERIQDEKNAGSKLLGIIIKHPIGFKAVIATLLVAIGLYLLHPHPAFKLVGLFAMCSGCLLVGKKIKNRLWIDTMLDVLMKIVIVVLFILLIITLIRTAF